MIAVIAVIRVKPGHEADFESVFAGMTAEVKAREPGCRLYQLARSRTETGVYKVLELYADEAALDAHRTSDHYKAGGLKLRDLVEGRPEVEVLDAVG